jgi:L-alanine-DL-glutamate epimerase-like enolase superfamily enzyme
MDHANCSPSSQLTLQNIATRAVRVPMNFALGTSAAVVKSAPLLLVDAVTDQGIVGRSYVFCYATQPLELRQGAIAPPNRPGLGIVWSEDKLRRLETI